ncbi:PTS sugar transporter subunit IIA [Anaerostipes faecalis]|uniref:PTS sugar transporter subunit IIA n=1 Tax=Anaerostipes faecalis TaxID=2738446 RepID=UPI003EFD8DC1
MKEVIVAENIQLNVDADDWRDSMVKSGQLLVDSGYITRDYIDLTIKCVEENGPYIVITPGLALSHSRPDVSIKKTGLSLITLNKPVCFNCDNDPVDIVLTLAATDDTSHLEKLQGMAEFISEEENLEFIRNAASAEEVAKAINEFEYEE